MKNNVENAFIQYSASNFQTIIQVRDKNKSTKIYFGDFDLQIKGRGKMITSNNHSYEGIWTNLNSLSNGKIAYPDNHKYEGPIQNFMPHGKGRLTFKENNHDVIYDG